MKWPVTITKMLTDILTLRGADMEHVKAPLLRSIIRGWIGQEEERSSKNGEKEDNKKVL